jgi:hypothetical protein
VEQPMNKHTFPTIGGLALVVALNIGLCVFFIFYQ